MGRTRQVRLFKNGSNQALRIPREFELPGMDAKVWRDGDRLIVESIRPRSLLALLAEMEPLETDFPEIESLPIDSIDL